MRLMMIVAAGLGLSACAAAPVAPRISDVQVERVMAQEYRVSWYPQIAGTPVDIFVADSPDAPPENRRQVVDDDTGGEAVITLTMSGRPYFFVESAHGSGQWIAERLLPLQGGRNFRDLGGYRTSDGHRVRWGKVYRSGSMAALTPDDYEYLGKLGIRMVCDFRTARERQDEPNRWVETAHIAYWTRDHEMSGGNLSTLFDGKQSQAQMRRTMAAMYRLLPYEQAPDYRAMFRQLVEGRLPLVFNCSAGKDRAGLAAALVLTALGVPRETILADFVLTNRYLPAALANDNSHGGLRATLPKDAAEALLDADANYLLAAFDEMRERNGSPDGYLRDVLELSAKDVRTLRRRLLD